MKKFSLKLNLYFLGLIPFLAFLLTLGLITWNNYSKYVESNQLMSKLEVIQAASAVVHESQKERGKSAAYLNGGVTLESLNQQRQINDTKIKQLKDVIPQSSFEESFKRELFEVISKYEQIRPKVTDKSVKTESVIKTYSGIIESLLDIDLKVAIETKLASVASGLRAYKILEDAKESGGKLRANLSAILATDKPISNKKFKAIIDLRAGLDQGLKSSGLVLDDESRDLIKKFYASKEWNKVDSVFLLILKNSNEGGYYQNSGKFFETITGALNIVGDLILHQKDMIKDNVKSISDKSFQVLVSMTAAVTGLILFMFYFMLKVTNFLNGSISEIVENLKSFTSRVKSSSESLAIKSADLAEAASTEASSLQETASSVDEISSMVERNADSAGKSSEVSNKSREATVKGKETVEKMIHSIQDISTNNNDIVEEMHRNNADLEKIVRVIGEIGEKTKVINDIVFQTKLLSFNASVEAARAGEHGKGFAVVAEEVGNLASMSGKAALEITEMLDSSINQVTQIVQTTKVKIDKLVAVSKEKVEFGTETAHECDQALNEILSNVNSVNDMVKEIALASSEQAGGVKEITVAMQSLDSVVHKNSNIAKESSDISHILKEQSHQLHAQVELLSNIISGDKGGKRFAKEEIAENVLPLKAKEQNENSSFKAASTHAQMKKAAGSEYEVPDANDPRFEDF